MVETANTGVLLVAHGTIEQLDQMPAFLTEIRQGRPPPAAMVKEMTRRYEVIGGSPLLRITKAQASALATQLNMPVLYGMRFGSSKLKSALSGVSALKLRRLVVLPMAPFSTALYFDETKRAYSGLDSEGQGFELLPVRPWGDHAGLVRAQREALLAALNGQLDSEIRIVVTAHSLPMRAILSGDTYARQVEAFVSLFDAALERKTVLAYQSQGQDSNDWLGPNLGDRLRELAESGAKRLAVVPIGFLCDHVETLYDLDHEAQSQAERLGLTMTRVPALNDAPGLIDVMANLVEQSLSI